MTLFLTFLRSESGAVTVDWVVLTAGIVGLGLASVAAVRTGTSSLGSGVNTSLSGASVAQLGLLGDDNFEWVPRYTQEYWDALQSTIGTRSDDNLSRSVQHYAANWRIGNDPGIAAFDAYAAAYLELVARGAEIPDGVPHPRDL